MDWKRKLFIAVLLLVSTQAPMAAGDEVDAGRFFDPSRLLTTGGLLYRPSLSFSLEPMIGLDYRQRLEEMGGGVALSTHKLHAEAGGTMRLFERFSLSTAAKIPVTTFSRSGSLSGHPGQDKDWRVSSDLKQPGSNLGWRSEVGIKLAPQLDLNLFYDQTLLGRTPVRGGEQPEESFGTRFIIRFK
jgi:hypothetical protein